MGLDDPTTPRVFGVDCQSAAVLPCEGPARCDIRGQLYLQTSFGINFSVVIGKYLGAGICVMCVVFA